MNLNLLKKLCYESGVSGDEERVREIIISEIKDFVDDFKIDNLGNLIVLKRGKKRSDKKVLISAHMDEVGFIVNSITTDGLIKFSPVGGINSNVVLGKRVLVGEKKYQGVVGSKPVHLLEKNEKERNVLFDDMYIDIGAQNKKDAEQYVSSGDYISFYPNFEVNDSGIISAKSLDDRIGCFLLIRLIKSELPFDVYFTFVVQEEVGLRGAKTACYQVEPDAAIVVEATTASDLPSVDETEKVCKLLDGPVISFMDKATIYDREYFSLALTLAKKENIRVQVKKAVVGGNDSGAINVSRGGVRTLALSLPCRYLHSQTSVISVEDIEQSDMLLKLLIKKICN